MTEPRDVVVPAVISCGLTGLVIGVAWASTFAPPGVQIAIIMVMTVLVSAFVGLLFRGTFDRWIP